MHTISAALIWEYWARNRWILLLPILCANLPWLLTLFLLGGADITTNEPVIISLKAILTLASICIVCIGVMLTQMNIAHLYLKPISTVDIVNLFGIGGSVLVGCQVALTVTLWKWLLGGEGAIVGPVFFSLVCWWAVTSMYLVPTDSTKWIIGFFVVMFALAYWYFYEHGIRLGPGGADSPSVHHWSTISGFDLLVGLTVLAISYVLTLRRVANHRNGVPHGTVLKRISDYLLRKEYQRSLSSLTFGTPDRALEWFDRTVRSHSSILDASICLVLIWLVSLVVTAFSSPLVGFRFALVGTVLIIGLKTYSYILMASLLRGCMGELGRDLMKRSTDLNGFYTRMFFNTLPITPTRMSYALIQSSAKAVALLGCFTFVSLFALGGLAWLVGLEPNGLLSMNSVQVPYWRVSLSVTLGLMLLSFTAINVPFTVSPTQKFFIVASGIVVGAILGGLAAPIAMVASTVAALALIILTYSTLQCLRRNDQSLGATVLIWLLGIVSVPLLALIFSRELNVTPIATAILFISLAMLPFFSMPAVLRKIRTI